MLVVSMFYFLYFLPLCKCFTVEISLTDGTAARSIKLVCGPPTEKMNFQNRHSVLWQGSQFGKYEQEKLAETVPIDDMIPNISVNSSKRHKCYLLRAKDSFNNKRVLRNSGSDASIPAEFGICPPGHRIDQDRCFPCFPGSYTSGQQTECFLCPKDFFMNVKAADSCWPCPEGKKTLAQGADSEEACVYFDDSGHPIATQNPPWVLILSLIGIIIACVWIIIIVLLVRYYRAVDEDDIGKVEKGITRLKISPSESDEHVYESISNSSSSDPDEHLYAEIGDFDDLYEEPIRPSDKKPTEKLEKPTKLESDDSLYEIPIKKDADNDLYEVPKRLNESEDNIYDDAQLSMNENTNMLTKKDSTGFEPAISPVEDVATREKSDSEELGNLAAFESEQESVAPEKTESQNESSNEILSSSTEEAMAERKKQNLKLNKSHRSKIQKTMPDEKMSRIPEEPGENEQLSEDEPIYDDGEV